MNRDQKVAAKFVPAESLAEDPALYAQMNPDQKVAGK